MDYSINPIDSGDSIGILLWDSGKWKWCTNVHVPISEFDQSALDTVVDFTKFKRPIIARKTQEIILLYWDDPAVNKGNSHLCW